MRRLKSPVRISECSEWISWFAWYPVAVNVPHGTYRVWLERVEYRYTIIDGLYRFEYRLPQAAPVQRQSIRITRRARRA